MREWDGRRKASSAPGKVGLAAGDVGHVSDAAEGRSAGAADPVRRDRFRLLYETHHADVHAYVLRRLAGALDDVPDVTAEVFTVAWRRFDAVPAPPEDRLWLYGVARRVVARHQRTLWRRARLHVRLSTQRAPVEPWGDGAGDEERRAAVREAISQLRPAEREVLALVLWERLSHHEAAVVLGCSVNAVALRLHRARRRLRDVLAARSPGMLDVAAPQDPRAVTALPLAGGPGSTDDDRTEKNRTVKNRTGKRGTDGPATA